LSSEFLTRVLNALVCIFELKIQYAIHRETTIAFTDKVERTGCTTHRQAPQVFSGSSQVSLHDNKITLRVLQQLVPVAGKWQSSSTLWGAFG
jgi:hypothetical protein